MIAVSRLRLFACLAFALAACPVKPEGRNHLANEKSPYLKQHASNPVWWYAWGDEAFQQAAAQHKPIFLSIGYSTCHWCHVMERESYSQQDVADALNQNFIAIKVDREERPDVDAIYMDAVQSMTGSGGWPLNVVLTPDRKPFFGGTYFPKAQLLKLIAQISETWKTDPARLLEFSKKLGDSLQAEQQQAAAGDYTTALFSRFHSSFHDGFDSQLGGRRGRPKFVPSYDLRVLLRIWRRTGDADSLQMVETTLDHVAQGGIYDHVGGGFHRYSTDEKWLVPHFEKMLYDQAALVLAYLEAFEATKNPEYKAVVEETLDYVLRDLTSPEGGFYSAEDADSEGVEGKFYLWSEKEIQSLLTPEELKDFSAVYPISSAGNFDGANLLHPQPEALRVHRSKIVQSALGKLMAARSRRVRPSLDSKILTSWNGLMIAAMALAGRELGEAKYAAGATRAAQFVLAHLQDKSQHLYRRFVDGEAKLDPYDEDYAFLIDGLIELYQTTFDKKWLLEAARLQADQDQLFWDAANGGYFLTTGHDTSLLRRGKNFFDNVTPSGNSMSAMNLVRLAGLLVEPKYQERAGQLIRAFPKQVAVAPGAFPQLLMALDYSLDQSKEIAIVGDAKDATTLAMVAAAHEGFQPNQVLAAGPQTSSVSDGGDAVPLLKDRPMLKGLPTVYVCQKQVCKLPVNEVAKERELIEPVFKYNL